MSKLAKLSQLFDQGTELVLPTNVGTLEVIWINKLNTFLTEECAHQGRVARARLMAAIREVGTPEYELFNTQLAATPRASLILGLASGRETELALEVMREVRSDPEWRDRIEIIEHSDPLESRPEDDPERQVLAKMRGEYSDELLNRLDHAKSEVMTELEALDDSDLRDRFRDQYVENRGLAAFTAARQQHELFHAMRECKASPPTAEGSRWDHSGCDHSVRYLDDPSEVEQLPEVVMRPVLAKYQGLVVPMDVARFTAGPASSSDSSGPSSSAEGSSPSSPAEAPTTPATTS